MEGLIVFDMDGVLAEVTESYREAIVQTVEHFTGKRIQRDLIQDYKNQGGWNNDWSLSQKIASDLGVEIPYDTVDDARSARAAGVPFIGIAAHNHSRRDEILRLFQQEQAVAIVENVNEIEGAL